MARLLRLQTYITEYTFVLYLLCLRFMLTSPLGKHNVMFYLNIIKAIDQ